ncbi:MAG: EAL domain-containing protein [Thalassotalea sp.]|nr:EAL domain-containing protein [Thalassotalea sp.]
MGAIPAAMSFKSFSLRFELVLGIATTLEHGQSITEVISHAGDAAIEAEKRQLLWLEFNDEVARYTEQQLHRMERLKQDIANDNLKWQLAPQIDTTNKSVVGFSTQVRWQYSGEQLELAEFIDVAEQSGELYSLTKCMIVNAFKSLFELKKLGVFQPVGVRLNSTDLLEPDLGDFIEEQIQSYGISARYLMVQMSEPIVQMACERARTLIDQLKALEVPICISDFDGSYESLRYIRKLSVDQLNISCQLLASEEDAGAEKAIVNSLVSLARTMKLSFIGTQVNDISSLDAFKTMGGHVAEGTAIAPSISMSELEVWVANWYKQYPDAKGRG